jgi:outer membrane lipoprotein-sorting protein
VFSAETEGGEKTVGIPTLSAQVARNGADRRVSFKLPDGSDLIYLEQGDKHIVIAPGRKQYAELTPEATGFQLQKLMTPGQLVSYLEKLRGVERVGDETINGRNADKYRYANTTNTSTSAGQVNTEAFVYVDKETGLPLRSELYSEASGNVQGVKGAKIVAEMRDISTTVDPTLFQVPEGLNKVPPEQVRAQIDAFTNTVAAVIKALLSNMAPQGASSTVSPTIIASPSPSVKPTN